MAARTTTEVLARARAAIADASAQRATDATCLGYVVDALNLIKSVRPDLFLGNWGEITSIAIDTAIPLPAQFFLPLSMFVGAMIESQDDESADRARGEMLAKMAAGGL